MTFSKLDQIDTSNETQIWFMKTDRPIDERPEQIDRRPTVVDEDGNNILVPPPWRIVGIGDIDGDGNDDIIWYHDDTHETQIWFMKSGRPEQIYQRWTVVDEDGNNILIPPPWRIVGGGFAPSYQLRISNHYRWHSGAAAAALDSGLAHCACSTGAVVEPGSDRAGRATALFRLKR